MKKGMCLILIMLLLLAAAGCSSEGLSGAGDNVQTTAVCKHSYSKATCLAPAECTKCGLIKGTVSAHSYEDGVCVYCKKEDPDWEPQILTGSEYERINSLMEGMYQYRLNTGNLVEYHFEDGSFKCYTKIGSTILDNYGTYVLTEKTLVLYYQNGTIKDCPWKLNAEGAIELFLLELD